MRLIPSRGKQSLHGLLEGFIAEFKRRVMHGQEESPACFTVHGPHLLGRGVLGDPGVVCANSEDGEVGSVDSSEGGCDRGIASEEDAGPWRFEYVGVVATMAIPDGACAPVGGLEGGERHHGKVEPSPPGEFMHGAEACGDERAGVGGGDDGGARVGESGERGTIEVVEVGVGDEDQIDGWKGLDDGKRGAPGDTERERAEVDADAA